MKPTFPPDSAVGFRLGDDKADIRKALNKVAANGEDKTSVVCRVLRHGLGLRQPVRPPLPIMDDPDATRAALAGGAK